MAQGIIGSVPYNALIFLTLYLQLMGELRPAKSSFNTSYTKLAMLLVRPFDSYGGPACIYLWGNEALLLA